jgi:hypothetical protein
MKIKTNIKEPEKKKINIKELEKKFKKMLHGDIKDKIDFSIKDFDGEKGKVIFYYDFEEIFTCGVGMVQSLNWYLKDNKKNYEKAKSSNNVYDRFLSFLDQQTGRRHYNDYSLEVHPLFTNFLSILNESGGKQKK